MAPDRVVIAGAGPVGLVAANHLAQRGIPVVVLESEASLPETLRASTFHPPTLDMLERFGVIPELLRMGLKAPRLQYRDRAGCIAEFDFSVIADATQHPYRLQCEQFKLNILLYEKLREFLHADVRFSSPVTGVEQTDENITAIVQNGDKTDRITGRFLIGADGARSAVREALKIRFEGFTWPERFLVVSTTFPFEQAIEGLAPVSYFADPEEWFFLLRVPGMWRVMIPTRPDETDAGILSNAGIERRLQRIVAKPEPYEVKHRTLYRVHQRVATRYRDRRAFLAGDAAHINNPLGGMGMNGGIHDAVNLAEKIAAVWTDAKTDILAGYERQRRPIALEYVNAHSTENKLNLEARDSARQARFRQMLRETQADHAKARAYLLRISMIASLRKAAAL